MHRAVRFDDWVVRPVRVPGKPRIICVPYAGAGASAFRAWGSLLAPEAEAWLLQLPGRENRLREQPVTSLPTLVADAAGVLAERLSEPFVVFGHSLGALVAFELAHELRRLGLDAALLAVRRAPHEPLEPRSLVGMADAAILEEVERRYGAIPPVVREDPHMRALFARILRADIALASGYRPAVRPPLACRVAAFGGAQDRDAGHTELMAWAQHTTGPASVRMFAGGHFYLREQAGQLVAAVRDELRLATGR